MPQKFEVGTKVRVKNNGLLPRDDYIIARICHKRPTLIFDNDCDRCLYGLRTGRGVVWFYSWELDPYVSKHKGPGRPSRRDRQHYRQKIRKELSRLRIIAKKNRQDLSKAIK